MNILGMPGTPCMICSDHKRNYKYDVLKRISDIVIALPDDEENVIFYWDINTRCKFGLYCTSLSNNDNRVNNFARTIEKKVLYAAKHDKKIYFQVMRLLQGEFPRVYKLLERIHYLEKQKN